MKININSSETIKIVLAACSLLLIAGCITVGPEYEPPDTDLPDVWHTQAAKDLENRKAPMHEWWTIFNDSELSKIISDVSSNNYSLAIAIENINAAAARFGVVHAALNPEIFMDGGYRRLRDSERIKFKGNYAENPYNLYDSGFSMSWELDLWGRVKRNVEAAKADIEASVEDYRDLLVVLEAEAALTYIGVRTAQQRLLYTKNNLELQNKTLKLTRNRFEAELTSELDIRQAEMNLATTKSLVPQLETAITQLLNQLCVLAGRNPGYYDYLIRKDQVIPKVDAVPSMLPTELLRRRPDIRAAERRLASQTALIGVAEAELLPMFTLNGYFDWQASTSSEWFDSKARSYGFGPGFSWSILNFGRIQSQIAIEEARAKQALAEYRQSVLSAWQESEDALTAYSREKQRNAIIADAVTAAVRSSELVQVQYKNGLTDFQNVLDTQRVLFQQQDSLAVSEGQVAASLITLYKSFGGGWSPGTEDNNKPENNGE